MYDYLEADRLGSMIHVRPDGFFMHSPMQDQRTNILRKRRVGA